MASPSAIGSTTPNTGAFTSLTVKASTGLSDRSITGSGTTSGFSIEASNVYILATNQYAARLSRGGDLGVTIRSDSAFSITSGNADATPDTILRRDGADTFAQRRSTNAQTFRLYNTFTDASNYERGFFRWSSNVLEIGAEAAGTGTIRGLKITGGNSNNQSIVLGTSNDITLRIGGGAITLLVNTTGWIQEIWTNNVAWTIGNTSNEAGNSNRAGSPIKIVPKGGSGSGAGTHVSLWASPSLASGTTGHTAEEGFRLSMPSTGNPFCSFGGTTSSFPALKRSSATLQVRLADDTAYTTLDAQIRLQGAAPASAGATGTAGDIRYDTDYIYVCTATNTWKRAAIATW